MRLRSSILHVCVSQCVDERVEHGGDHGVKQGKNLVVTDRISRGDIGEDEGQEEQEHDGDVGATGGEGFAAALGGAGPQRGQDGLWYNRSWRGRFRGGNHASLEKGVEPS